MEFNRIPLFFTIIWSGIILYFSIKIPPVANIIDDKSIHIFSYFVLAVLIFFTIKENSGAIVYAILSSFAYGIMMEIMQLYVPGRSVSLADAAANLIGAVLVTAVKHGIENLAER